MERTLVRATPHFIYIINAIAVLIFGVVVVTIGILLLPSDVRTADDPYASLTEFTGTMMGLTCCCPGLLICMYGLYYLARVVLFIRSWHLTVTNQRVKICAGIWSKNTDEMLIHQIESIKVRMGILGRVLNYGRIEVVGTGGTKMPSIKVSDPELIRDKVNSAINSHS